MVWMEGIRIEKVAICEMGAKDVVVEEDGARVGNSQQGQSIVQQEYKEIASVELPGWGCLCGVKKALVSWSMDGCILYGGEDGDRRQRMVQQEYTNIASVDLPG